MVVKEARLDGLFESPSLFYELRLGGGEVETDGVKRSLCLTGDVADTEEYAANEEANSEELE